MKQQQGLLFAPSMDVLFFHSHERRQERCLDWSSLMNSIHYIGYCPLLQKFSIPWSPGFNLFPRTSPSDRSHDVYQFLCLLEGQFQRFEALCASVTLNLQAREGMWFTWIPQHITNPEEKLCLFSSLSPWQTTAFPCKTSHPHC